MLNLDKRTKTKAKPTLIFKKCSHVCVPLCTTVVQHRTVLIIFHLILQTIITA